MLAQKDILITEDPRWFELTGPLQDFMAAEPRTWADIFSWAEAASWGDHFVRNAVAWLEVRGLAAWSWSRRCWRGARARPAAPATAASESFRRTQPPLHHRTCHVCEASFFSRLGDAKLCPTCRPTACDLCGAPLPEEPVEDRFCSIRHARRSRRSSRRPHRHSCALPECGVSFWGARAGSAGDRHYCCAAHRARSGDKPRARKRQGCLSPAALRLARQRLDELGLTLAETAASLGVHPSTLRRHIKRLSS